MSWKRFFRREQADAERQRELDTYLRIETEENIARGMAPAEAHHAAQRKLGNTAQVREEIYRMNTLSILDVIHRDLRYGVRGLRANPSFAAIAILTLGLGIGASTAIFTVVDGVLLRPLPYPQPDRLVMLWETRPELGVTGNFINAWNFLDWRERTRSFDGMAALQSVPATLTGEGEPVSVPGVMVSPEIFSILRVRPAVGRSFDEQSSQPGGSVVISNGLWMGRFGGDKVAIGKRIVVNGAPTPVAGVLPAGFSFPGIKADVWMPMRITRERRWGAGRSFLAVARMKTGVSVQQAGQDLAHVARQLAAERPDADRGWSAEAIPLLDDATKGVRKGLLILLGAAGFLLLIACANVANLFLLRGAQRSQEMALRKSLGASFARILSQLIAESLTISLAAAAAGIALTYVGLAGLLSLLPESASLPRAESIGLDMRVLGLALAVSALSAVFFGLAPLVSAGRKNLQGSLRLRAQGAGRLWRDCFVAVQIALALVLLVGASLMIRSFARLVSVDPGFTKSHILTMDFFASPARFLVPQRRAEYHERLLEEVRCVPGVEAASTIQFLPLEQKTSGSCFTTPEDTKTPPASQPGAQFLIIGPSYLTTMGIRLAAGREFTERDRTGSPSVILVNQAFVRRYFGGQNPIGRSLTVCWTVPNPAEIVGVVGDTRQAQLADAPEPTIFVPDLQSPAFIASLVVRTRNEPGHNTSAILAAIHRVDADQAVAGVRTMDDVVRSSVARPRFQFVLLLAFAAISLVLAAIGVYGVISHGVSQRTREIGIRLSLGAQQGEVRGMFVRQGLMLTCVSVAVGLGIAAGVTRLLASTLFEISPLDPLTYAIVPVLLIAIAVLASYIPARRVSAVDPAQALKGD